MLSPMWSASSGAMSPAISNAIPATIQLKCQLLKGRRGIRGSPSAVTVEAGRGGAAGLCASVLAAPLPGGSGAWEMVILLIFLWY
jgi:hypothetical protein